MNSFDYHAPTSVEETLDLLATHGEDAHLMAGGTALVLLLNQGLVQPGHVVGLGKVGELQGLRRLDDGGLQIRALTTHRQAELSADVQAYCPSLAETFGHVATVRIRNQATVGGNLAHADPAQDPPPMLIALGGEAVVVSKDGERRIPLDEFFIDYFETALQPGEVLVSVDLPPLAPGTRVTYKKFLPRTQDDYATVSVAASLVMDDEGRCKDVRVALGAAGTTPIRARGVEAALRGQQLTVDMVVEAAAGVREEVDPLDDLRGSAGYKREMARVWTKRALTELLNGGGAT
ncbi:MAG TPA: xanthine dehydrogenase family protein subunit M [Chloroflexota bacterium]|nr:xanthine dehydrogenase family protein subunit M [Chloroflexota bacterium]